jgi:hypothetical protein
LLFRDSQALTPGLLLRAYHFLRHQGGHVWAYPSTYYSPGTHLTGEALGLFYLSLLCPELKEAAAWRRWASSVLVAQMGRQVHEDGVHFEQSACYHAYTCDSCLHHLLLDAEAGSKVGPTLERMLGYLLHLTRPDGTTPLIGDDDGGKLCPLDGSPVGDWRRLLATGALLFGRGDLKRVAGGLGEETLWLLGPDAADDFDRLTECYPETVSASFPQGGYYVMRSGWGRDDDHLIVDCGPLGAALLNGGHGHADLLACEVSCRGEPFIADPGTGGYRGEVRELLRSTGVHATLGVDGLSQARPKGPFGWEWLPAGRLLGWVVRDRFAFFDGEHGAYGFLEEGLTHGRSIFYRPGGYWVIFDGVQARDRHRYVISFPLDPAVQAERGGGRILCHRGAATLAIEAAASAPLNVSLEDMTVSPGYGSFRAGQLVSLAAECDGPLLCVSVLRAGLAAETGPVTGSPVSFVAVGSEFAELEIEGEGWRDWLLFRRGEGAQPPGVETDCRLVCIRRDKERGLEHLIAIGGSRLNLRGREHVWTGPCHERDL